MARHDLPSGGWVELRTPDQVPERARRAVSVASAKLSTESVAAIASQQSADASEDAVQLAVLSSMQPGDLETMLQIQDFLIVALVAAWSYPFDPSADSLLDLPGSDYDHLQVITAPFVEAVRGGVNTGPSPDPSSPTVPSNA